MEVCKKSEMGISIAVREKCGMQNFGLKTYSSILNQFSIK
jgi:hypothetical protein